jgi:DNA-directed RNA polymerase specialized sigma24 family protein
MTDPGSLSLLLERLKAGESAAVRPLWEHYFGRLVELAHQRLRRRAVGGADAEDVALSAFACFCRGAQEGRFPRLEDRDDLWQVLLLLTRYKTADLVAQETRQKRGGGKIQHFSALAGDSSRVEDAFAGCFGREPTPDFAAEVAEESRRLLGLLSVELRTIAVSKMDGYTNHEIASRLGCSVATVERRLNLIRKIWSRGTDDARPPPR